MDGMNYRRVLSGSKSGALFQEFCERVLRIALDNQAFLFRPSFTFSALHLGFFRHLSLISQLSLLGNEKVPRSGVGPEWLTKPRECKSRLSTSSSTGAKSLSDVGAVTPLKEDPAPTFFGSSNSAHA